MLEPPKSGFDTPEGKRWMARLCSIVGLVNVPVPASATASGRFGQYAVASGFVYFCIAKDTWRRVAISAF